MAYARYKIYSWVPPELSPAEEIEVGRRFSIMGRAEVLRRTPFLDDEDEATIARVAARTPKQQTRILVIGTVLFVACAAVLASSPRFWAPMLIVGIPIVAITLGTMFIAKSRYEKWVDLMIARYAESQARGS